MSDLPLGSSVLVINAEGRVLLVNRRNGKGVCMPGGKVEPGEDPRQAAVREVHEETGLLLNPGSLQMIYQARCDSDDGQAYQVSTWLAGDFSGSLNGGQEPELDARWGPWRELLDNSPFAPYNKDMVAGFLAHMGRLTWWTPTFDRWMDQLLLDWPSEQAAA